MKLTRLAVLTTLALATACEAPGPDAESGTHADALRITEPAYAQRLVDGAGLGRAVRIDRALVDPSAGVVRYEGSIDGDAASVTYTLLSAHAVSVRADAETSGRSVELVVEAGLADFAIDDETVGAFPWAPGADGVSTPEGSDPIAFAMLSVMPHQLEGLEPETLFVDASTVAPGITARRQAAGGLFAGIGKLLGVHIKVNCETVRTYKCGSQCTTTPEGQCGCGSACGPIPCCSGACEITEAKVYGTGG
jgi:hypothetical protein